MAKKEDRVDEVKIHHAVENEQVVVAASLVDADARDGLVRRIPADRFHAPEHRAIWAGLVEMGRRKLAFDPATLQQIVGASHLDLAYVAELVEARPERPPNLEHHVEVLLWDHARLSAAQGPVAELLHVLKDPRSDPDRVRALARAVGAAFDNAGGRRHMLDPDALVSTQVCEIEKRREGQATYPFGVPGLDADENGVVRIVPGAKRGTITVVTGTSGSGKTPMVANMVLGLARQRRRVLYGAWEVKGGMTLEWLALLSLGLDRSKFQLGDYSDEQLVEVERTMRRISRYVTFLANPFNRLIGERKGASNERNLDVLHAYIADSGCDVFVADLFERCLVSTDPDDEKHALFRTQAMIEECDVHAILVAQQRLKDVEQRADKRPTRDGIKGSSAWVEVPDNIFGTNRPALWRQVSDDVMELHVMKQRVGRWPMLIEFDWNPETYSITNGREVPYEHPGEQAEGREGLFAPPKPGKRTERGRTRRG